MSDQQRIISEISSDGNVDLRDGSGEILFESVEFEDLCDMERVIKFAIDAKSLQAGTPLAEDE